MARIADLEEKLRKSSRNSSKPPSSDGPALPARPPKIPSGRKPGGQEGHEKHERPLVSPEKVSKRVVLRPKRCRVCGSTLAGDDPSPHRHQVFELPRVEPIVTEYELHSLDCACGVTTRAELPAGVPTGAFGPSVSATIAVLMGVYRLSKRAVPDLLRDLFGLTISVGAVVGCQQAVSVALETPVEEAKAAIAEAPVKYADETGWREARRRAFLWTVVTGTITIFLIQARRTGDAAHTLLGKVAGVLVSDRHGAYNWWARRLHQFCWSHLRRDFQAIAERGHASGIIGAALLEEVDRMFAWWHRVRDGTLTRTTFRVYMRSVQRRVEDWLAQGASCPHRQTSRTCKKILKHADALWTFVRVAGVEPTNNTAERALRHAVLWRKSSYGTHSQAGSRFVERILTTHATLRQQRRNVIEFVRLACAANLRGDQAPSLLPIVAQQTFSARSFAE
jgi:transposase